MTERRWLRHFLLLAGVLYWAGGAMAQTPAKPPAAALVPSPPPAPATTGTAQKHKHKHETPVVAAPKPAQPKSKAPAAPAPAPAQPTPATAPAPPPAPDVPERAAEAPKGAVTGLPLPRFAALRSDEVNMRSGPGTRYPIDWVYHRRDLPVEIEREFEVWRLITDPDGVKGWVHQATLTGRRAFVVRGTAQTLRASADAKSDPVAILKPGVIGRIRDCAANVDWCQVLVGDYRGWLKRDQIWGTYAGEAVN